MGDDRQTPPPEGLRRRHLLGYLGAAGAGIVGGAAGGWAFASQAETTADTGNHSVVAGQTYSPHQTHQAGIITPTPAATRLIAINLRKLDREPLVRLMKLWAADISALMAGRPVPGDTAPELAQPAISMSVTVGFGPRIFTIDGLTARTPTGFVDIPAMQHDRLQQRWSGGDVLAMIAADDPTSVAYASRVLLRDAASFATLAWQQDGSWRGTDGTGQPVTGRNLFGQVDGTANPTGNLLAETIWLDDPDWITGGTTLAVRRIEMDLHFWDQASRERQEKVIGRRLSDGAPLTGNAEFDELDLSARDASGTLRIATDAHARRAHPEENNGRRILRRALNYSHTETADGQAVTSTGLIFCSFQASLAKQFIPIQTRLDALDALNDWTRAIGSAVFALPGGFPADSYPGQALLES